MKIRSRYSPRVVSGFECKSPSRTKQSFKEEADINNIMKRYRGTGIFHDPASVNLRREAFFGDVSTDNDFHSIQNRLAQVKEAFLTLPAELRKRFDNDPSQLIEFVSDPENMDECISLGLVDAPADPSPAPAEPVSAPVPTPEATTPPTTPPEASND